MASADPFIGQVIDGRYTITAKIGQGGMAVVYRAHQPSMERDVAIKILGGASAQDADFIRRFKREVKTIASLQHPHILPVYDYGELDGSPYLVMRLLEEGDLKDRMEANQLALPDAIRLLKQIASALAYAHERGIVHRDLKPQNILMDSMSNPYLTDFGIAKLVKAGEGQEMTATGVVLGTPTYMAPEQWMSQNIDARTDVYALGIIAYSLLTGELPFAADTAFGLMYKHLDEMPQPLEKKRPDLPSGLTAVVFRAMAKKPDDRYSTATDFAEALDRALLNQSAAQAIGAAYVEKDFATKIEAASSAQADKYATRVDSPSKDTDIKELPTMRASVDLPVPALSAPLPAHETAVRPVSTTIPVTPAKGGPPVVAIAGGLLALALLILAGLFFLDNQGEDSPSPEARLTNTPSVTAAPTQAVATAVACTLTAQSGEVKVRQAPLATAAETATIFGGDTLTASAQTADGWYYSPLGWVFGEVMRPSSPAACGALPLIVAGVDVASLSEGQPLLCEVLTANTILRESTSAFSLALVELPKSARLPVYATALGADGLAWYRVLWADASGTAFTGWVSSLEVGTAAGTCPAPSGLSALFGNPYLNRLGLSDAPLYADDFAMLNDNWALLDASKGRVSFADGFLRVQVPTRVQTVLSANAGPLNTMFSDGYISFQLQVVPNNDPLFFVETIVRGFYTVRISELGRVEVAADNNPSLIYGSTPENVVNLAAGLTFGIRMAGPELRIYTDGVEILRIEDEERMQGLFLRWRFTNRSQTAEMNVLLDEFAYWDSLGEGE